MAEVADVPMEYIFTDPPEAIVDVNLSIHPRMSSDDGNVNIEPMDACAYPATITLDERDFSKISDHITVWVDVHIGKEGDYEGFKRKFENLQVLKSNRTEQETLDDDTMIFADQKMLESLSKEYYCLKYFSEIPRAVEYIRQHVEKRIFFISSGTVGKEIVPEIYNLPQIQGIYIFCGHISAHVEWAGQYVDNITAMLEHQDNLLTRLSRDIAEYLEAKGDRYRDADSMIAARNCYSWAKKILTRAKDLGDNGAIKYIRIVDTKLEDVLKPREPDQQNIY